MLRRSRRKLRLATPADTWVTGAALASTMLPYVFAHLLIRKRQPTPPSRVNPVDRVTLGMASKGAAWMSVGAVAVALALATSAVLKRSERKRHGHVSAALLLETVALNGALNTLVKYAAQRPLPRVDTGQAPRLAAGPRGYRGFYSGHVSLACSALGFWSSVRRGRFQLQGARALASAALGAAIGAGRLLAGKHFISDVLTGAVAGAAIGVSVPRLHA